MQGEMVLEGIDADTSQDWTLRYGPTSGDIQEYITSLGWWMTNTYPPWVAYRAILTGLLIVLYKCPGVCPVVIGEIIQSMMGKFILKVFGEYLVHACGIDHPSLYYGEAHR